MKPKKVTPQATPKTPHESPLRKDSSIPFELSTDFRPMGDQPQAIRALVEGVRSKQKYQTLLGVTGSGKTFTMANVIRDLNMPSLILAPNKTLAAQLYSEFKGLFPKNAVEFFVSYYDYYQPEAYLPSSDVFIEKDSSINDEIDKLRHAATQALFERRDVIIVASVSCIYGLGSPETYRNLVLSLQPKQVIRRDDLLRQLVVMGFVRNDLDFHRGTFRVRGDVVDIFPAYSESTAIRVDFFGHEIEGLFWIDALQGNKIESLKSIDIYPASHYVIELEKKKIAIQNIREELRERLVQLKALDKKLEYERLEKRTMFDLEMLDEVGYCPGIENYSRHFAGRKPGEPSPTLIDYFNGDWLLFIDESHLTVPQVGGMYRGDYARKINLVEHGFRLPCALDNRPLKFEEFEQLHRYVVFVSATPADFELQRSQGLVVEQVIRPTGLLDPIIEIRPAGQQVADLMEEAKRVIAQGERVLVTTLTKKMSEDLTEFFQKNGMKVRYLHSDVETLERIEILRDLRRGVFDVLVGINLLREGLDLPEVSLVGILDADKEGFLRSRTSLIQTFGRAARNARGRVILYADKITRSMEQAIGETDRRRAKQIEYNKAHGIVPQTVRKKEGASPADRLRDQAMALATGEADYFDVPMTDDGAGRFDSLKDLTRRIRETEKEMKEAARELEFERAAELRNELLQLREWELKWKDPT